MKNGLHNYPRMQSSTKFGWSVELWIYGMQEACCLFLRHCVLTKPLALHSSMQIPQSTPMVKINYTAKLIKFHQSPSRHSDYSVTGRCSNCYYYRQHSDYLHSWSTVSYLCCWQFFFFFSFRVTRETLLMASQYPHKKQNKNKKKHHQNFSWHSFSNWY